MKRNTKQIVKLAASIAIAVTLTGCATGGTDENLDMVAYNKLVTQAESSAAKGDIPAAIMNYINAQEIMPTAENWHRIGMLQLEQGNQFPAMSAFQSAITVDRNYAPSLEAAGLLYLHWKQHKHAQVVLERAIELDDKRWRSHNGLGIVADLNGDPQLAQKHYQKALQLQPDSPDVLNNIGYSHFLSGDNDGAQAALDTAISRNREHRIAWDNLARVKARQKQYAEAFNILVGRYDKAIAYHDVGYIALLNGDYVFADDYLSKAIHASPSYFEEAYSNREAARNRMIGSNEGRFVTRQDTHYPFCIGLGEESC
jgi:Flp pilus assembly protein TadD